VPPHPKYATDSTPGKPVGLHYTGAEHPNYALRPRERGSVADFTSKIAGVFLKLRNPG
jgi:hypothetical protein